MTIRLQRCGACGARQYPERDLCRVCLADALRVEDHEGRGRLVAEATLRHTLDPAVASELPLRIGTVALDEGVRLIVFLAPGVAPGETIVLRTAMRGERPIFIAEKEQGA
jgi:uncharacterized OB-fold protein